MDERCKHQYVVSFSGGKDSTAMLFMLLERGCRVDRVINIDTTKEFPQMYEHLEEVQKRIPIQIETASFPFDYWFCEHVKTKGKAKGCIGYGWPTIWCRWCTALKRDLFDKVLGKVPATIYIGLAADERRRVYRLPANKFAPLALWGVKERHALTYCKKLGFTWGGLYDEGFARVSCFCCPLQSLKQLKVLYTKHPDLWAELRAMDARVNRPFRKGMSVAEHEALFS